MAPLPVNSTGRLVVDYLWRDIEYTTLYRWGSEESPTTAITAINAFHILLLPAMTPEFAIPGSAVWYPDGANFGSDVTILPQTAGTGGADAASYPDSLQYQVVGRSIDGRKASWYLQGVAAAINSQQRLPANDEGVVDLVIDAFNYLAAEGLTTISSAPPVIKPYLNIVFNDYLTRRAREGG